MKNKQKLELTWIGKDKQPVLEPRILIEDPEKSYGDPHSENMLIHGDNLLALKALEQKFAGKVKCIYIDPPYNTGSAFEHYDDGLEHSVWLTLMRDRLIILWDLLCPDGSLWISIDDREMPYLRVVMDEICGRKSFIASNIWQKRYSRENREAIGDVHEYVLVYAKTPERFKLVRNKVPLDQKSLKVYKNLNNDPKGDWRGVPMTAQGYRPNQMYKIQAPGGKIHLPPEGRCWSTIEGNYKRLLSEGRIYFGKDNNSQPNTIRYLSEVEGHVPWTWWNHEEVGHTDEAKKEIHALFGKENAFGTPKPERLINRVIHIASNPGDLVLDSFLGSGTTSAVAHKMGRRWIGIELGDHCDTHCVPRLQKVCDGTDQGGISKAIEWKGGGGFKYYDLAPSLLKKDTHDNYVISEEYNADMLAAAMAKQEGFLYQPDAECYWKQGFSTEQDYIFTTTNHVTVALLDMIAEEMGKDEHLLICCKKFSAACAERYPNIQVKKIPGMLMGRCEFGKEDYSLNIVNLTDEENTPEFVPEGPKEDPKKEPTRKRGNLNPDQMQLF